MAKILKITDYYALLTVIYKYADYDKNNATLILKYVSYQLLKHTYKSIYIDKLILDLNLVDNDALMQINLTEKEYKKTIKDMENTFNILQIMTIKSLLFDIIHKGYYE